MAKPCFNKLYAICTLVVLGLVLFVFNLFVGSVNISFSDVFNVFFHSSIVENNIKAIVLDYRLPQALTAMIAGGALAVAGLLMQTLFRNPLADPSILGISSGASLGVALLVLLTNITGIAFTNHQSMATIGLSLAAFLGALLILLIILALSSRLRNMVSLILVGIMISYLTSSAIDILKFFSRKEDIHAFVIWGMGSFSNVSMAQIPFFFSTLLGGLILCFFVSKPLNLLLLGDRYAENLGLNIRRSSMIIILLSGYLTAIVTAFCGPIAFIGLAVPHIARFLFKTSEHKILIPTTLLCGMVLALFCNLISRLPSFDGNLPINAVTAIFGAPIVIWIIFYRQKMFKQ